MILRVKIAKISYESIVAECHTLILGISPEVESIFQLEIFEPSEAKTVANEAINNK